jgi:cell division protein FtsL
MSGSEGRAFLAVWTLATAAAVSAFVVHLALRGRTVELGYELGRARQQEARLREVKRVLEVEAATYKAPERVEIVARTLLAMETPSADRIVSMTPAATFGERKSSLPGLVVSLGQPGRGPLETTPAAPRHDDRVFEGPP